MAKKKSDAEEAALRSLENASANADSSTPSSTHLDEDAIAAVTPPMDSPA